MIYRFICAGVLALLLVVPMPTLAYELGTHARLTQAAVNRSILSDSMFVADLGVDPNALNPFGDAYYDVLGSSVQMRSVDSFETKFITLPTSEMLTLPAWLMRGAIREDDLGYKFGFKHGDDPHDDPYGSFWRVMNHFYDPVYNRPLTLSPAAQNAFLVVSGEAIDFRRAPDWALGTGEFMSQPNTPQNGRRNHFTVFDAREAMYRALTGRSNNGKPVAPKQEDRNKYWATTFRALGDVVHLVQDMAQPQHTRNDAHVGDKYDGLALKDMVVGHKSVYENYIAARAIGADFMNMPSHPTQEVVIAMGGTKIFSFRPVPKNPGPGKTDVTFSGLMRVDTQKAQYW